jgi:hypothetical protein
VVDPAVLAAHPVVLVVLVDPVALVVLAAHPVVPAVPVVLAAHLVDLVDLAVLAAHPVDLVDLVVLAVDRGRLWSMPMSGGRRAAPSCLPI